MSAHIRSGLSGLEYFKRMIAGEYDPPPMLVHLGIRLVEAEEGRVVFAATVQDMHYNGMGVAHGGFAATMLDSSLGCCMNTLMSPGKRFTTLELNVNLTRPLTKDVGLVRCEGKVIHVGGRVATSEGTIVDGKGKLYAHGTTTCIVVEERRGKLEP